MARMVSKKKDCIGSILSERPDLNREDGLALVGFFPVNSDDELMAGAHFVKRGHAATTENDEGWMTSVAYSPSHGHTIGLGFIKQGAERQGEILTAVDMVRGKNVNVEIVSPHFIDPEGERLRV